MSTDEEHSEPSYTKKRKIIQRACDNCRKKKTRCNEPQPPHDKCSNCIENELDCTYELTQKKRGRTNKGYVEKLERRVQMLEVVLQKLCPDQTILYDLISPLDPEYAASLTNKHVVPSNPASSSSPEVSEVVVSGDVLNTNYSINPSSLKASEEGASDVLDIIHKIAALTLGSQKDRFRDEKGFDHIDTNAQIKSLTEHRPEDNRFWGDSSGAAFLLSAISAKTEHTKDDPMVKRRILQPRRPIFWTRLPWVKDLTYSLPTKFAFPPPELTTKLTVAYFEHANLFFPLLHRPTFERAVAENLHFRDEGFGSIFLLVCAVGSRYTEKIDPRTLPDGVDSPLSAGWKWYSQVQLMKLRLLEPPSLYELQSYCLAVQFLAGGYPPQAIWILVGLGIRLAQDVGAHRRRRVRREMLTVEDELWKRAFWILVAMDRVISMIIGRQCAILDDHFDQDMPIECDDEYWEHPDPRKRFRQPDGIPSTVTAFNQRMQLNKIMSFTLNTIYSIKTKFWEFILEKWEQHIVAELDSAMNNWINSLPEYLCWDPNRTDDRFFRLSGSLITYYHYIQILIHRRYIQSKTQSLAFPSLAICNSAARSCSMVLEQLMKHNHIIYPHMQMAVIPTTIVLLLNIWGNKRGGLTADKEIRHVEQCLNVLRKAEERWHSAGRFLDILNELSSLGGLAIPEYAPGHQEEKQHGDSGSSTILGINEFSSLDPAVSTTFNSSINLFNPEFLEHGSRDQPYNLMPVAAELLTFDMPNVETSAFENINSNLDTTPGMVSQQHAIADNNTMAMWLNAPTSFQLNEWNVFMTEFTELTNELGVLNENDSVYNPEPFMY